MAILTVDSLTGVNSIPDFMSGTADGNATKTIFYQSAAPTSWTKDTTNNDAALRIVGGINGTPLSPGGTSGYTQNGLSKTSQITTGSIPLVTVPFSVAPTTISLTAPTTSGGVQHPGSTQPTTLSITDLGPHTHQYERSSVGTQLSGGGTQLDSTVVQDFATPLNSSDRSPTATSDHVHPITFPHTHTATAVAHNHTINLTPSTHGHPTGGSASANLNPLYVDVIIATKN